MRANGVEIFVGSDAISRERCGPFSYICESVQREVFGSPRRVIRSLWNDFVLAPL